MCNICNDIYYGKAKRHLKVRACEHLGITPLTRKKVKSPPRPPKKKVLMILKPLSKSLIDLYSSSESRF